MEKDVYEYFKIHNYKPIKLSELIKVFDIDDSNIDDFANLLFDMEKRGLIIGNDVDRTYQLMPKEYIYVNGQVELSNNGNLFCQYKNGCRIMIRSKFDHKKNQNVNPGDYVLVEPIKSDSHQKTYNGQVVRIINKMNYTQDGFFYRAILMRNSAYSRNYVRFNNYEYEIPNEDLNCAYTGDQVSLYLYEKNGQHRAKVISIIKRKSDMHLYYIDDNGVITTCGTSKMEVNVTGLPNKICNDSYIICREDGDKLYFVKEVNDTNEIKQEVEIKTYENGIPYQFPPEVLKEANELKPDIENELSTRMDLRNIKTFTIDPKSAKDLDDAVSIVKDESDNSIILIIHIADVTHYVKPESFMFQEACNRGQSIYPPGTVIPMYPEKISNDLCSLNPNNDKLAKSIFIKIKDGKIIGTDIKRTVINSNKKMNYDDVNKTMEKIDIPSDYIPYIDDINAMEYIGLILQQRRINRGYIDLNADEIEFIYDDNDNIIDIKSRKKGKAELFIENCALLANEIVTNIATEFDLPFAFRNHEAPSEDQLGKIGDKLKELNIRVPSLQNANRPEVFQARIRKIYDGKSEEEIKLINKEILCCMNRATYSDYNIGHFALAYPQYGTFTSPIRKLSDTTNHLTMDVYLDNNEQLKEWLSKHIEDITCICTEKQLRAEEFEDEINAVAIKKFLLNHFDDEYRGLVTDTDNNFVSVKIKGFIMGTIPQKGLGIKLNPGDIISVKVNKIEKDNTIKLKYIEFLKGNDKNDKHKRR